MTHEFDEPAQGYCTKCEAHFVLETAPTEPIAWYYRLTCILMGIGISGTTLFLLWLSFWKGVPIVFFVSEPFVLLFGCLMTVEGFRMRVAIVCPTCRKYYTHKNW